MIGCGVDNVLHYLYHLRRLWMLGSTSSPKFRSSQPWQAARGKKNIDFESFAKQWNCSADGKTRYYVTTDVLNSYSKTWDKISNIRASQDLITAKIDLVRQTGELFSELPFPESLKGNPTFTYPQRGVLSLDGDQDIPQSISVGLAISHPRIDPTPARGIVRSAPVIIHPRPSQSAANSQYEGSTSHDVQIDEPRSVDHSLPLDEDPSLVARFLFMFYSHQQWANFQVQ